MTRNNLENFRKIPRWIKGKFIKFIAYFNHSLYMKMYIKYLKQNGMDIKGNPIYIGATTSFDGRDYSKIHIGDRTVISSDVRFLTHDYSISRAIEATGRKLDKEVYSLKDIYIGNNCFIGTKSILMPGCRLGNNVIVGAGSVVRGEIPDNSMVIGNPAIIVGDTVEWAEKKLKKGDLFTNK
jgi:acetyltransferase-like isoleucine patch superfamily enzyme